MMDESFLVLDVVLVSTEFVLLLRVRHFRIVGISEADTKKCDLEKI